MKNIDILNNLDIDSIWIKKLDYYLPEGYLYKLAQFIEERRKKTNVFPQSKDVFRVFKLPFDKINVILTGQDPYYTLYNGKPIACGLSFAPSDLNYEPPSLKNIKKELENQYEIEITRLNLTKWWEQGVFLYNTALTVEEGKPKSHFKAWEPFTIAVFKCLQDHGSLIYMLWGLDAKSYKKYINPVTNDLLEASHPSPMSANKGGWFGNNHFKKCNEILKNKNNIEIQWI